MKPFKTLTVIALLCAVLSSYFSPVHLRDLVIIEGVGIDVSDGALNIGVQLLNTNSVDASKSTSQDNSTVILEQTGNDVAACLSQLQTLLSKDMYFGHNKLLIISREAAESALAENLPFLIESVNSRADIAICISQCSASDILKSPENNSRVPCENIVRLIKNNEKDGGCVYVTAAQALDLFCDETSDLLLPVLGYSEDDRVVYCYGIALFDGGRLRKIVRAQDADGLLMMLGRVKKFTLQLYTEEAGKVSAELTSFRAEPTVKLTDSGAEYSLDISFKADILSAENVAPAAMSSEETEVIKRRIEEYAESECLRMFRACQQAGCDCLGAGRMLALVSSAEYETARGEWNDYFRNMSVSINADAE